MYHDLEVNQCNKRLLIIAKLELIICHFLPPGGSMGPSYAMQTFV